MENCIFCRIANGDAHSWKIMESRYAFAFLDINPVSRYHTLIIPKKHYKNIFDIPENQLTEIVSLLKNVVDLYHRKLGIKHLQIVNSNGEEAQQDVFHLHFHIVPRKSGDGQNIRWKTFPEWRSDFEDMIERLSL